MISSKKKTFLVSLTKSSGTFQGGIETILYRNVSKQIMDVIGY
jgi:hypothetical protein